MKEKFAKESRKVYKMLGGLINQQTSRLQAKGVTSDSMPVDSNSASPSELGSKRNLSKTFDEATDFDVKRTRIGSSPTSNRYVDYFFEKLLVIDNVYLRCECGGWGCVGWVGGCIRRVHRLYPI